MYKSHKHGVEMKAEKKRHVQIDAGGRLHLKASVTGVDKAAIREVKWLAGVHQTCQKGEKSHSMRACPKENWCHVRRKDEKLLFTTAVIIHDHYSTTSVTVEHHLRPHQPKRSRITSLVTQTPKEVSVMSEVCGPPGFLHLESSRVCSWTDTHWLCKILYRWTLKNWPEGASSMRGHPPPLHTHTLEKHGGEGTQAPPRVPTPMNFSKHVTDWSGVSTVELCGWKKRDLSGILRYVRAQKWGGGETFRPPLPGKWGGERPPCLPPPFLRLWPWNRT